jgi:tRNA-specific 2-thiouridylase
MVKLRSTMAPVAAHLRQAKAGWQVHLAEPQFGIAQGQAAVLYAADSARVLGGGWINAS